MAALAGGVCLDMTRMNRVLSVSRSKLFCVGVGLLRVTTGVEEPPA